MSRHFVVKHVEMGTPQLRICDHCGGEHEVYPVVAMDSIGVLLIAEMRMCPRCGRAWVCLLCPAVLPVDGELAHQHVMHRHAG